MTVNTDKNKIEGLGNGSATVFSFSPVVIPTASEIEVTHVDTNGVETVLSQGTTANDYSLSVSSFPGTGSITFPATGTSPMPTGEKVVMKLNVNLLQKLDLQNQGPYNPENQEQEGFDRSAMRDIQQQEEIDRSIKPPIGTSGFSSELPALVAGAALVVKSDKSGLDWSTSVTAALDTVLTTPAKGELLRYNGTKWTNRDEAVFASDYAVEGGTDPNGDNHTQLFNAAKAAVTRQVPLIIDGIFLISDTVDWDTSGTAYDGTSGIDGNFKQLTVLGLTTSDARFPSSAIWLDAASFGGLTKDGVTWGGTTADVVGTLAVAIKDTGDTKGPADFVNLTLFRSVTSVQHPTFRNFRTGGEINADGTESRPGALNGLVIDSAIEPLVLECHLVNVRHALTFAATTQTPTSALIQGSFFSVGNPGGSSRDDAQAINTSNCTMPRIIGNVFENFDVGRAIRDVTDATLCVGNWFEGIYDTYLIAGGNSKNIYGNWGIASDGALDLFEVVGATAAGGSVAHGTATFASIQSSYISHIRGAHSYHNHPVFWQRQNEDLTDAGRWKDQSSTQGGARWFDGGVQVGAALTPADGQLFTKKKIVAETEGLHDKASGSERRVLPFRGWRFTLAVAQSIPNNSWTDVAWDTEDYDPEAIVAPGTNLAQASTGWAMIFVAGAWASNNTGKRLIRILKNGFSVGRFDIQANADQHVHLPVGPITFDSVNDTIKVQVLQDSGGALDFGGSDETNVTFWIVDQ